MDTGAFTEYMDVAQVALYVFWIFFIGLVFYIRREDTREGYPLEADVGGRIRRPNFLFYPKPVEYKQGHGEPSVFLPNDERDTREIKAKRLAPWPGAAYVPTGDPMADGVGPAAWAERSKKPELTHHGELLNSPLRTLPDWKVTRSITQDPRGFQVLGADGETAGKVKDIWVDRAEQMARFLEVELSSGKSVLLPLAFARVGVDVPKVTVVALNAHQFDKVPQLSDPDQLTMDEEERISAYYGGGYMYADPKRAEPLV